MKKNHKLAIFYIVMTLGIILTLWLLFDNVGSTDKIVYSDLVKLFENQEVKSFEVDEKDNIIINKHDGSAPVKYKLRDFSVFYNDFSDLINEQVKNGIIEKYEYDPYKTTPWWVSLLPTLAIGILLIVLWIYMMNQATGKGGKINSFGRARTKINTDEKKKVFFKDVAGADEEKE